MAEKQKSKRNETKEEAPRKMRITKDMLFLAFALFVIFIVLFWVFSTSQPFVPAKNDSTSTINYTGNVDQFSQSLLNAESMAIVANVTGLTTNDSRYVYACSAGLAGSWGKLGKNISELSIYVIDGDECTFSSPSMSESQISNQSTVRTTKECVDELNLASLKPTQVSFQVQFGSLYTIFSTKTAYIFVNSQFTDECSFRIPTAQDTGTISAGNSS